jgi:signal transduction histidine kinase
MTTDTLRVLVVDDEPGMRKGTERTLRHMTAEFPDLQLRVSFAVTLAASGEDGLAAMAAGPPDILLLDYKLPGLTGLEVQEELANRGVEVLTIMVSAYGSLQTVITATKRGAFDFLVKPFTPDELRVAVHKAARHLLVHRQAIRLAEERRQIRFEFIRVLGHELKAPLAAVEGYLRLLQKRSLGPELPPYDQVVERSLIRLDGMRKLILDLLDLTRIESGNKQRVLAEVDLCQVAATAVETATPEAEPRRITFSCDAPASLMMTADRGELEIILNNLLSNAVKYNRAGGQVQLTLRDRGPQAEITVADTGIGMAPEDVQRLFGEFVRIKNEKTVAILGSGLGLSIVKKLVALYHGDVTVESTPDVGTTLTVVLQRYNTAAPSAPA